MCPAWTSIPPKDQLCLVYYIWLLWNNNRDHSKWVKKCLNNKLISNNKLSCWLKVNRCVKCHLNYTVVAVLDLSTADPFPHPGFCLLDKFCIEEERVSVQIILHTASLLEYATTALTSLSSSSIFDLITRVIFPTSSTSFSIRCLIAANYDRKNLQ